MMLRIFCLAFFLTLHIHIVSGQLTDSGTRYAEEEIQVQDLYIRANQKKILQKYDEALEIYGQLLEKNEVNAAVHHDMARIYMALEKSELAVAAALKAVRYDPENTWFLMTLAQLYEDTLDPTKAAETIAKVIKINPSEDLYERWAINLEQANQYKKAITAYNLADRSYGMDIDRSDSKVDLYLSSNNPKEALKEVVSWTERYPENIDAWVRLARYYEFSGNQKKSLKTFQKVLSLDPNNEEALFKTQEQKLQKGVNTDLTTFISDSRIDVDKKITSLIPLLSSAPSDILPLCNALIDQYPDNEKVYALYGDALWLSGDASSATEQYKSSLAINKGVYEVWSQLMMALEESQDFEELEVIASEAIDFYPNQAGPYHYLAQSLYRKGNLSEAIESNQEANFIVNKESPIYENIVILDIQIMMSQGEIDQALDYAASIDKADNSSSIQEIIGDLFMKNGDKSSALKAWEKALELGGTSDRIAAKINSL